MGQIMKHCFEVADYSIGTAGICLGPGVLKGSVTCGYLAALGVRVTLGHWYRSTDHLRLLISFL